MQRMFQFRWTSWFSFVALVSLTGITECHTTCADTAGGEDVPCVSCGGDDGNPCTANSWTIPDMTACDESQRPLMANGTTCDPGDGLPGLCSDGLCVQSAGEFFVEAGVWTSTWITGPGGGCMTEGFFHVFPLQIAMRVVSDGANNLTIDYEVFFTDPMLQTYFGEYLVTSLDFTTTIDGATPSSVVSGFYPSDYPPPGVRLVDFVDGEHTRAEVVTLSSVSDESVSLRWDGVFSWWLAGPGDNIPFLAFDNTLCTFDFPGSDIVLTTSAANCGNGSMGPGEQCDDGNLVDGDGCAADCTIEPITKTVPMVCVGDLVGPFEAPFELTIDPNGPVVPQVPLPVEVAGNAVIPETTLDGIRQALGPLFVFERFGVSALQATVETRSGGEGASLLSVDCSVAPLPNCGFNFPISTDCATCEAMGKGAECATYGNCIAGDLIIPLAPQAAELTPQWTDALHVGWHEDLPLPAVPPFSTLPGPNGMRVQIASPTFDVTIECTMGTHDSASNGGIPLANEDLLSIPIVSPVPFPTWVSEPFSVLMGDDDSIEVEVIALNPYFVEQPMQFNMLLTLEEELLNGTVLPLSGQVVGIEDAVVVTLNGGPDGRAVLTVQWPNDHTLGANADVIACLTVIERRSSRPVTPNICATLEPGYL